MESGQKQLHKYTTNTTWKGCKINGKQKTQNDVKLVKRLHESEKTNSERGFFIDSSLQVGGMRRKALQ